MIESGTLQCFDLTLTTQGLLHIGGGKVIPKKFYMLNGNTISYIDEERLFALLLRRNQLERFEAYCLGADTDLGRFFKSIALSPVEQHALVRCTFRSADALDENHSCKEIRPFIGQSGLRSRQQYQRRAAHSSAFFHDSAGWQQKSPS